MSSKPKLPGVDQTALEALARQFPSHNVGGVAPQVAAPETKPVPAGEPAKTFGGSGDPVKAMGTPLDPPKAPASANEPPKAPVSAGSPAKVPGPADAPKQPPAPAAEPPKTTTAASEPAKSPAMSSATRAPGAIADASKTPAPAVAPARAPEVAGDSTKAAAAVPSPAPAAATVPRSPRGGRGLAALALLAAVVALVLASSMVAPPWAIQWLKDKAGPSTFVDFLTERRDGVEARFAAGTAAVEGLDAQAKAAAARLEAIEAVGGSSQAAAKRIDALEAAVNGLTARLAAADELTGALVARFGVLQARIGEIDGSLKATGAQIAALGDTNQRALNEIAAGVDALKKVDRRPEKLFLASMQLRNVTQSSASFAKELAAVAPLAGNSEELRAALRVLASRAESGVPTVPELRATFAKNVAPRLAAYAPANRESVAERGTTWVRSFFVSGQGRSDASGSRNAAAVAAAERSLGDGQLAAAVNQLLLLEDNAALVTTEWLREASARLAIDKATAAVLAQAFEQVTSTP